MSRFVRGKGIGASEGLVCHLLKFSTISYNRMITIYEK